MSRIPNSTPKPSQDTELKYTIKDHLSSLPQKDAQELEQKILRVLGISQRQWRRYKNANQAESVTIPEENLRKICKILAIKMEDVFNYSISLSAPTRQLTLEKLS